MCVVESNLQVTSLFPQDTIQYMQSLHWNRIHQSIGLILTIITILIIAFNNLIIIIIMQLAVAIFSVQS